MGGIPRVAGLSALLADISTLRTTLQADLSLAAAALDEGEDELAGELVAGDVVAVRNFEARAFAALEAMDREPATRKTRTRQALTRKTRTRRQAPTRQTPTGRRSRAGGARRRLVPTAPLLVAVAALIGFALGVVPDPPAPAPVMSSAAGASYELNRLAVAGASTAQLRTAAEQLNDEVAAVVAASGGSPAAAAEALLLLERGSEVLLDQGDAQQMQAVLSETRRLADQLRSTLPANLQQSFPRRDGRPPTTLPGRLDLPPPIAPFPRPTTGPPDLPGLPAAPLLAPAPSPAARLPAPGGLPGVG
ncbi:MAG: hypothetical protein KY451_13690 [Actinobacteria bacterium]|nr:hypothetical protein [Actinomycetota bacterium]MBW3648234.1 hypothetical protein [Actinomycetota bacterium]